MKKIIFLLLFSNFIFSNNIAFKDSVKAKNITVFNTNYREFTVIAKSVYAITNGDSLISINLKKRKVTFLSSDIKSIQKTSNNELIGINSKGEIFTYVNRKLKIIDFVKGKFQKIYLDRNDNPLIFSNLGLYYLKEYHIPTSDLKLFNSRNKNLPLRFPDYAYIDKKNRLWISYDRGEWGEDTIIFDLLTKKFQSCENLYLNNEFDLVNNKLEFNKVMLDSFPGKLKIVNDSIVYKFPYQLPIYNAIKGISENNRNEILITQSLMHFDFSGGIYLIFEEQPYFSYYDLNSIIEKQNLKNQIENNYEIINEYIGTCTYNEFDKHFYYYSDKGFFKIIIDKKIFSKEFIFRPWVTWTSGLALAVGYQMNVNKFEFLSKKEIVFLTANNGIGYFNGNVIIYYK